MRTSRKNMENSSFFHIMVQGINKEFIFNTNKNKEKYLGLINKNKGNIEIIAYCIMDNHAHILSKVLKINDMQEFMKRVNTSYAHYYNKINGRVGYVFRDRYKTQIIKNEQHMYLCVNYIHDNPIKAKLCENREDYAFSSYANIYEGKQEKVENRIKQAMFGNGKQEECAEMLSMEEFEFMEDTEEKNEVKEIMCQRIINDILSKKGMSIEQLHQEKNTLAQTTRMLKDKGISYRIMEKYLKASREKLRNLIK